jgi:endonuclease/exonuclease/phosphatase family metal-dependent hydrolase
MPGFRRNLVVTLWTATCWFGIATATAETLTLATYNVENYGLANRITEAGFRPEYPKPEAQKAALRKVIRSLNADVLILQEMGPQPFLDELRRDLRADGCDYPHAALALGPDQERHVAVLSKRPLKDVVTLADLEFAYFGAKERVKRGLLQATIETEAGDLALFALHLKSQLTDRADDPESATRRSGEARAIRDAILKRFPDPAHASFVVLGDCNDTRDSRAVQHLQRRGEARVSVLLPAADSRGETWTYAYKRRDTYSKVDHIFVSAPLVSVVAGGAAVIFDGDGVSLASDHRPVVVTLRLSQVFAPRKP